MELKIFLSDFEIKMCNQIQTKRPNLVLYKQNMSDIGYRYLSKQQKKVVNKKMENISTSKEI